MDVEASSIAYQLQQVRQALALEYMEGASQDRRVTATVNGKQELIALSIDPQVMAMQDIGALGERVLAAVNNALRNMEAHTQKTLLDAMRQMHIDT